MKRLFTFSGIRAGFGDVNDGQYLVQFGNYIRKQDCWAAPLQYQAEDGVDHFRSYVNFNKLFSDLDNAVRLDGSEVLNNEARDVAPHYGKAMFDNSVAGEDLLILAHSQGTNNVTHSLLWLEKNAPDFFEGRKIHLLMFDPKVGVDYVSALMASEVMQQLRLLFLQSEKNLLGNQNLSPRKFIDEFESGDHLFVRDVDHSTIVDARYVSRNQEILTLPGYRKWNRDVKKESLKLQRRYGRPLRGSGFMKLRTYVKRYPYDEAVLKEPILEFAKKGKLTGPLGKQSLF